MAISSVRRTQDVGWHTARMDSAPWAQVDVSAWEVYEIEQSGTSVAEWLMEPSTGLRWLHKPTDIPSNGVEQGEDWSEVIATQVAVLLGVPCAPTRLCVRGGRRTGRSRDQSVLRLTGFNTAPSSWPICPDSCPRSKAAREPKIRNVPAFVVPGTLSTTFVIL